MSTVPDLRDCRQPDIPKRLAACSERLPDLRAQPARPRHVEARRGRPSPDLGGGRLRLGDRARCREHLLEATTRRVVTSVRHGRPEKAVRPLLGEQAGLAKHDRHIREPHLRLGEAGDDRQRPDPVELEDRRVPVLDDDSGVRDDRQIGKEVAQPARRQGVDEIGEALAFDGSNDPRVDGDRVVAGGERPLRRGRLLAAERPRVALVRVDDDLEHLTGRTRRRDVHVRSGLPGRARALPEDHLAPASHGEDELRPVLAAAVEHEVDRRAAAHAGTHRDPLHHLEVMVRPRVGAVAVELRRPRPHVPDLQRDAVGPERQPHQEGQ